MLKTKMRDMPVVAIHLNPADKKSLTEKAESMGMRLATYCRFVLLQSLQEKVK